MWFLLFTLCVSTCEGLKIQHLDGQWFLKDSATKYNDLKANVPGGVYTDLMANNIIDDVFHGYQDTETRWVAKTNWIYYRTFAVDDSLLSHANINIVFDGLDTFATISINGLEVGTGQNMFMRYIFSIGDSLKSGNNSIEVKFASPISMAASLAARAPYTVPPNCNSANYRGECHVNQIRKMQASFAWDWGPALPSMGIWKPVYLEAFNSSIVRYLVTQLEEAPEDAWQISISTYLGAKAGQRIVGKLILSLQTDVSILEQIEDVAEQADEAGEIQVKLTFTIPRLIVRRWWPNGYGDQILYNLTAEFQGDNREISSKSVKVGFRTVELIQEPLGGGLSFYFKINDVAFFAKGANEIPLDILPEKGQDPAAVLRILQSARDSNMNMLRVWGGGVYESDFFYDTADELGILIWQDFMFACAMYPAYPEFLSNVAMEVRHQFKRLNTHPSIALWAGNNENEVALMTNWYGTQNNLTLYKNDYIKLYVDTIQSELEKINKDAIFLTSSPTNGLESEQEGYLAKNPQDPLYGDVHYYNYLWNSLDVNTYPIPRFASEFGYQSLPDVDSWLTATDNLTDLDPGSIFMDHRQHHPLGLIQNNLLIGYQLNFNSSSKDFYKTYIYYSQIVQALSIKFETEIYRSYMGRLTAEGKGNTMGALFWQLNDVWVAPTWSGIDYTGRWKMLQYFAKEFFAPTIVTGFLDTERRLRIFVVAEVPSLLDSSLEAEVLVEVYNWNSFQAVNATEFGISLEFGRSLQVTEIDVDNYLKDLNCGSLADSRNNCFFYLTLKNKDLILAPTNLILPGRLKDASLIETIVKIESVVQVDSDGKKFEITIISDGISLFVWLNSHEISGRFSENGFIQITNRKLVVFHAEDKTSAATLIKTLTLTHLKDVQHSQ